MGRRWCLDNEPGQYGRAQETGILTVVSLLPQLYAAHGGASVDVANDFVQGYSFL
jgi:hypothetical protein